MNNYKLRINPTPDKTGDTNITINATADNKINSSVIKSFSITPTYNKGIGSYDDLIAGGVIPDIGSENPVPPLLGGDSTFFVPFQFSEDGVLTLTGLSTTNSNINGTYTPESGKWKNSNLEPIKYTGDNGINFILRYVKSEIYKFARADFYQWDIQIINKLKYSASHNNTPIAGNHIGLFTYESFRWGLKFGENSVNRPARMSSNEVYYTQEVKDAQEDDSFTIIINASSYSETFKANMESGPYITQTEFTEEQKSWGCTSGIYYYGSQFIKIPDMNIVPKGIHRIPIKFSSDDFSVIVLHKEI